ncbi:PAS domain S-box protein [Ferruginibacter sp. SUN106]|uniref:PAS domain S-box protein n=1 Tax=Ferruginibacter sp. SUN106 TaxID=2978348 RepID=UPI003D36072A
MVNDVLKILILEDNDADAEILQRLLKKNNFNCQVKVMMTASAYRQALDEFKPDLILSDNDMPQFNATEALQILQQYKLHIPFILVTGTVSEEFAAGIIKAGADDYLLKDRLARLPAAIEAALKQKQTEKEKNEAAERLLHSEEQYRSLIQQASDGIFIADPSGRYIDVNESGCKALGYSKEEFLKLSIKDLVVMDGDAVPSRLSEVNTETPIIQRRSLRKKDGTVLIGEISAKKMPNGNYFGIVRDLTERIEADKKLEQSEKRFRMLVENNDSIISLVDKNRKAIFRSSSAARLTGWTKDEFDALDTSKLIHPDDIALLQASGQWASDNPGKPVAITMRARHKEGHYIWLEGMMTDMTNDPALNGVVSNLRDITERREAEKKIVKANRLYFFISQINQMIVRTTDENTLFEEVCRIAVELGEFKMAWIGLIDEQTKTVIPVKHAGEEKNYLSKIKTISIADVPEGRGPTGTALREGRYMICNDIENDSSMYPWKDAALKRDYQSSMSLPIKKFGKIIGAFSVYASEKNFFDDAEIALLEEATGDVAFALENFEKEALRKSAEIAVKLSEEKYTSLVNTVDGIVWEADAITFQFSFVSKQAERLLGYPTEQWINNPTFWGNHIHEDDRNWAIEFCKSNTLAKKPHEFEYRMVASDGRIVWLRDIVSVIMDNDAPVILRGIMIDITERKKAEEAIIESEKRYQTLTEISPVGIFHTDAAGITTYVNPKWSVISGLSGREALGNGWLNAVHEDDKEPLIKGWQNATTAVEPSLSEYRFVRPDGTIAWVIGQAIPEKNADNQIVGYVGTITDITERKMAEKQIFTEKELSDKIINSLPGIFYLSDTTPKLLRWNKALEKISGFTATEIDAMRPITLFDPEDHKTLQDGLLKSYQEGTAEVEIRLLTKSGERIPFYFTGVSIEYGGKPAVLGIGIDMSERKKAEEEIKKVNQRFEIIAEATKDAVFEVDLLTGYSKHNKAFVDLFDFGLNTEPNTDNRAIWRSKLHPDDKDRVIKRLEEAYAGNASGWTDEFRFQKADGSYGIFYDRASIIRDATGKAVRFIGSMVEITELKKAEEEIKRSNERFELIAKATHDGLWDWNLETGKLWGNEVHQQLYGLTVTDPVPDHEEWKKRIHPDDRERTSKAFEEAKATTQESYTDEYRFLTANAGWMDIYGRTLIQRDKEGKAIRLIGSMMDITERKKTEAQLAANEKRFRKLVENGNDAFAILNPEGKAIYVSSSVERVLGYTEEEIYQLDMFSLVHPDNIEEVQQTMQIVMANPGLPVAGHLSRLKHKDGTWRWFEDTITNLLDDADIRGIVDNFRDITERVNDQMALQQSEQKHRDIVENITDILCTHDLEGKVLSVNLTAKKQLGYEVNEMLNMHIQDILQPQSKDVFGIYIDNIKKNGFAQGLMYVKTSTGEKRIWEFRNSLRDNGVNPPFVYGFAQDVTERIIAEEKLLAQKVQLETLSNNLPGVMIYQVIRELDGSMHFTYISDGVIGLIGKTPKEVTANPSLLYKPIVDEDVSKLIAAEQQSFLNMSIFQEEVRFRTHEGDIRWLNIVSVPRKLGDGRTVWDGFHVDVTDRKNREEEIMASEEKRRLIMNSALDAIICIDTEGMITFWNPQAEKVFGWKEAEVMGSRLSDIIIPEAFRKMHEGGIKKYLKTGEAPALNVLLELNAVNRKNEEFPVELTVLPIKQGGEEFFCAFIRDITQRKKAEIAIKESEEKYRTLVEQASDGIFIADNTGKFIIVNTSACKLSGYSAEELNALTIYDLVHPESLKSNPFHFEEMMHPQGARSERKMICKDGTVLDIEISAKFLSDKRFIAFIRDISERIKAAAAIKFSEEKYRSLVEQASDAIFISDKDGRFITVNPSACKLSQYTEEELLQMTIFDFFIKEDIEKNPIQFEALEQGKTIRSERIMKRKDGGLNHLEITAKLLNDGKLLSFVRDISERIKAQNEILKEKNLSDSIINSLPGVFYLYNRSGKFLRWNTNFEKVTLYSAAEIKEMHPLDFYEGDEKLLMAEKIDNVFANGEDEVQANFLLKNKEKIPYYFTGIAIDYEGETCLMGVGIDFSERERAEQEIEKTTEKLRELTAHLLNIREEERKRIGREIHDELGQQLTAIKMDVSWIDKKTPPETELIKNKLKNIITLLDGSNQSIRRILSELRPGILDDYGLVEALEWQNRQFTANTGIPVEFVTTEREIKLPEPLATCIFRVYQEAFTNITRHSAATKVITSLSIAKNAIIVTIKDNGKGFETTATRSKKSFGILGMKERVLAQGGMFEMNSAPGKGTSMEIQLPFENKIIF